MLVGKFFNNINQKNKNHYFSGLSFNSKNIKKNNIFFAIEGSKANGKKYIKEENTDNMIETVEESLINNKILKKIGEEATEVVMACKDKDTESIANEAADLIFHLQVALAQHKVKWRDVLIELARRRGAPRRG